MLKAKITIFDPPNFVSFKPVIFRYAYYSAKQSEGEFTNHSRGSVRGSLRPWVRPSQFISGTAEHIFLKFCTKLEKKNCTGPIFDKKWLKITILISAYRRILPFLLVYFLFIYLTAKQLYFVLLNRDCLMY